MNPIKHMVLIISRLSTVAAIFLNLLIDGAAVGIISELKVFGVVFDTKLSFESHIRLPASSAASAPAAAIQPAWRPMTSKINTFVEDSHMEAISKLASLVDTATYLATEPKPGQLSV